MLLNPVRGVMFVALVGVQRNPGVRIDKRNKAYPLRHLNVQMIHTPHGNHNKQCDFLFWFFDSHLLNLQASWAHPFPIDEKDVKISSK